ncbi:MAG: L,D-transpeptidase [Pyrinomonadaceae bacterium]
MQKSHFFIALIALLPIFYLSSLTTSAQTYLERITKPQSARSDKVTGGSIAKTALVPGEGDIKITVNVPAFQLTLWQNGKEVKTYFVGVGMKDYPIYIGELVASEVIWNPNWIPPDSDWVNGSQRVTAGEVILPTDPRNPLGKLKIPLGSGYLIHQAKGMGDLGSLVSHGCIRVLKTDLYDLAEKIAAARALPLTKIQIENAKLTSKTLSAKLDPTIPVEITYDTHVVEAGRLHIYPDIYDYETNNAKNLRQELVTSGVDVSRITDLDLERILSRAVGKKQFVVSVQNIEAGRETSGGQILPVVLRGATEQRGVVKKP